MRSTEKEDEDEEEGMKPPPPKKTAEEKKEENGRAALEVQGTGSCKEREGLEAGKGQAGKGRAKR